MRKIHIETSLPARAAIYAAILILFFVELTLFEKLRIYGVKPELLLVATIFFGFHFGASRGAEAGAVTGILKDIFSVGTFGINTFSFLAVGLLAGYLKGKLFKDNFVTQFFFSCFSVYLVSGIYLGTGLGQVSLGHYAYLSGGLVPHAVPIRAVLCKGLYTGFLAPFLFFILSRIFGHKPRSKSLSG